MTPTGEDAPMLRDGHTVIRITELDPRQHIGPQTNCRAYFLVERTDQPKPCAVFHDPHGRYCAYHGVDCEAVAAVENERARNGAL